MEPSNIGQSVELRAVDEQDVERAIEMDKEYVGTAVRRSRSGELRDRTDYRMRHLGWEPLAGRLCLY